MSRAKRLATLALLTAAALMLSYIEALIPLPMPVPGIKLGLANLAALYALYRLSLRDALCISCVRVTAAGFLFGNPMSILYGLSGAIASLLLMALLKRGKRLSLTAVSACGGAMHNAAQLCAAMLVLHSAAPLSYAPVLLAAGLLTGTLIGLTAAELLKRIK